MRAGGFKALIDTDKWSLVGERSHRWSLQSRCFQLPRAANGNSLSGVQLLAKLVWLPWSRAVSVLQTFILRRKMKVGCCPVYTPNLHGH